MHGALVLRCAWAQGTGCMQPHTWAYLIPYARGPCGPEQYGETMYGNAHSCWKYDANAKVTVYDMEPVAKRAGKELAISAAGSADGRT